MNRPFGGFPPILGIIVTDARIVSPAACNLLLACLRFRDVSCEMLIVSSRFILDSFSSVSFWCLLGTIFHFILRRDESKLLEKTRPTFIEVRTTGWKLDDY